MKKLKKNQNGFTLIELLAAIVVLAIIVVMAIPQISSLIDSNNDAKYDAYAGTIETSAKLYTDSYNEDMFGSNQSGCYDIKFHQMEEKKLLEDINLHNITCAGGAEKKTFARVYKTGNHYKYKVSILCTNKDNETAVLYSDLIETELERECDGRTTDEDGPTISIAPNGQDAWVNGKNDTVKITVSDVYGLLENIEIRYAWTTDKNNIPTWTTKNFRNKRYAEKASVTIPVPQGKTGEYYLVVEAVMVRDANGNYYSGSRITSNAFKFDNTPPRITATTNSSNGNWTNSNVEITATATDTGGGVDTIYYGTSSSKTSINKTMTLSGSTWKKTFTTEMKNKIYVMAVDEAGNESEVVLVGDVNIDKTKPTCTVTPTGTKGTNNWWKQSNVTMTLATSDPKGTSSVEASGVNGYNLTTSTTASYTGTSKTATQTNTNETGVTWYGYVKDQAGNVGTCNSGAVKVDTTAPTCTVNATGTAGNNGWFRGNATVSLSTSDGGNSKVDSYDLTTSTTASYKNASSATQKNTTGTTWYGYVKDKAGNTGSCNKQVKVDTTAPTCSVTASGTTGTNGWYKSNATITLTANDSAGGYNLTTSTSPSYGGTSKTATQTNTTGTTWYGYVKDAAGNVGSCNSGTVKVDTTAPTCSVTATGTTGTNGWFRSNATVKISTSDGGGSNVNSYNLTTSTTASYSGTSSGTQANTAGTKWYGYVKDNAGNTGSCNTTVKVDTTAPTCSVSLSGTKNGSYYATKVNVSLNKNDSGGSSLASYGLTTSSSATYNSTASGTQSTTSGITWYGYVKDNAGNTGSCNSGSFVVKLRTVPEFTYSGSYQIVDDNDNVISNPDNYNGNWKIRFLSSGTFKITNLHGAANGIDVFLVGGGGNGGGTYAARAGCDGYAAGGGGGGGGYRKTQRGVSVSTSSYSITVAGQGGTSTAFGYSAAGGSNGGSPKCLNDCTSVCAANPGTGGASGGYGEVNVCGWNVNGGSGGYEFDGTSGKLYGAGGGGGHGHNGGVPALGNGGNGGAGGGGSGNRQAHGLNTHNATANTGSGGGGASYVLDQTCYYPYWSSQGYTWVSGHTNAAGKGASGIVIIRNKR